MQATPPSVDWSDLAALLRAALVIFGGPRDIWEDAFIDRRAGLLLRAWLRALEALARALLLPLALRMPMSDARRAGVGRGADRSKTGSAGAASPEAPGDDTPPSELWAGVAFALAPPSRAANGRGARRDYSLLPARRLAFRLEALLRVAAAPDRYARRLARRLRRDHSLVARMLRPLPPLGRAVPVGEVADAQALAWTALKRAPETG